MFWTPTPPTLATDFNTKTADGLVRAISEGAVSIRLEPGQEVRLEDTDGNSCVGVVHQAVGRGYWVVPVWSTWSSIQIDATPSVNQTFTREPVPA